MKLPWDDPRCIVCLGTPVEADDMTRRTDAHVIPQSVGGRLSVDFLCNRCNSEMGRMEATLARDVTVRWNVNHHLRSRLPGKLVASILNRMEYFADTEEYGRVVAVLNENDELEPKASETIKGDRDTLAQALAALDRCGASDDRKEQLRWDFVEAESGTWIDVRPGYRIERLINWEGVGFRQSLNDPMVGHEVPLGIAYLYLALCLRDAVYDAALEPVRLLLRKAIDGDPSEAHELLPLETRKRASGPEPQHLLRAKNDGDGVVVAVQIFRDLAWPIPFPGVRIGGEQILYVHDIEHGAETWCSKVPGVD